MVTGKPNRVWFRYCNLEDIGISPQGVCCAIQGLENVGSRVVKILQETDQKSDERRIEALVLLHRERLGDSLFPALDLGTKMSHPLRVARCHVVALFRVQA